MSTVAQFVGATNVIERASAITLVGFDADRRRVDVTFVSAARASGEGATPLPTRLQDARVNFDGGRVAIDAREGHFEIPARSMHRHADVGAAFGARLPPRTAPLGKRIFWRLVLALAGSGAGRRLLLRLRGR